MAEPSIESVGPYRIDRELGRGGMGIVYLARDSRLDRQVAIKALPEHVALDPERLARFEREARALAALNHPNVAGIYGVEEHDGHRYLILEFVEGQTLAERLDRGPLPVDEAIEYAVEIAAGIEAAHEAGVIHRDLKPDNIKITPEGKIKVLDFGLAKASETSAMSSSSQVATLTTPHSPTVAGAILGTAPYMSPEQARGRHVDKRTDIWSFGVVLFEMLTGSNPFRGETATDSIGAIMHKDIDLDRLPPGTPPAVRAVLQRCLARDKQQRFRDIGDVRIELEHAAESNEGGAGQGLAGSRVWLAVACVLLLTAIGGWVWVALRPAALPMQKSPTLELTIPMPKGHEISGPIAISRDGKRIAFVAEDESGESRLYIRELDRFEFIEVPGSREAWCPTFSPDGLTVLFKGRDSLFRAPVDGGRAGPITKVSSGIGICAMDDGSIVYSTGVDSPLWRIPAGGGAPVAMTDLAAIPGTYAHVWPQQIPGTNKLLLTSWGDNSKGGARIADIKTGAVQEITDTPADRFVPPARWIASGHLILEAWGTLIALPFDPDTRANFDGAERNQVLTSVAHLGSTTRCVFDVSDDGTLAYVPAEAANPRLVWVNADGTTETVLEHDDSLGFYFGGNLAVSPDGAQALIGNQDIAVIDLTRRIPRRLTFDGGNDVGPVWSSDASRVFFNSNREDRWAVWSVAVSGAGNPELVYKSENSAYVSSVSPDGLLCIDERTSDEGDNLWIIEPGGKARSLVRTRFEEHSGAFSTDGRWVAYESDISGRDEIYVIRTSGEGQPFQISSGGGEAPKWGPLGSSLYYRVGRSIVRIQMADGRPKGEPERVFKGPTLNHGPMYSLSPDETRLLAIETPEEAIRDEIRIITNFFDRVERIAGPGSRKRATP